MIHIKDSENFLPELFSFWPDNFLQVNNNQHVELIVYYGQEISQSTCVTVIINREAEFDQTTYRDILKLRPNTILAVTSTDNTIDTNIDLYSWIISTNRINSNLQINNKLKQYDACALLGGWTPTRELIVNELKNQNLINQCLVNLQPRQQPLYIGEDGASYYQSLDLSKYDILEFTQAVYNLRGIFTMIPVAQDQNIFFSQIIPKKIYNECYVSIISETETANDDIFFLSEKTAKALLSGHPFFLNGCPNSLKKLQEIGFKTFNQWWDESYDAVTNKQERVSQMIKSFKSFSEKHYNEKIQIINNMKKTLTHNQILAQNSKHWLTPLADYILNSFKK